MTPKEEAQCETYYNLGVELAEEQLKAITEAQFRKDDGTPEMRRGLNNAKYLMLTGALNRLHQEYEAMEQVQW